MNTQRYFVPAAAVIAVIVVLQLAGVHLAAIAPFALILIICPLMMFFMMRGMGHGNGGMGHRMGHGGTDTTKSGDTTPEHQDHR